MAQERNSTIQVFKESPEEIAVVVKIAR
ncbi:hypothetical protein Godav_014428, partial [Gossypium davidsonii]|nr:hypothetical protein [Gossypium davidsonii]